MRNNPSDKHQRRRLAGRDTAVIQRRLPCVATLGQGDRAADGGRLQVQAESDRQTQKTGEQAESRSRPL